MPLLNQRIHNELRAAAAMSADRRQEDKKLYEHLWNVLTSLHTYNELPDRLQRAQSKRWSGAVPVDVGAEATSELVLDMAIGATGVDGSQIYPDPESEVIWAYVQALAHIAGQPAEVTSTRFYNEDVLRPSNELLPNSWIDLERSLTEIEVAAAAALRYKNRVVLLDGPLLPFIENNEYAKYGMKKYVENLVKGKPELIAGVVSSPNSKLIISLLQLAEADTFSDGMNGSSWRVKDKSLMRYGLKKGERTAIYKHGSPRNTVMEQAECGIYFFFARINEEIVRVEIPEWVAADEDAVNTVHASVVRDCQITGTAEYSYTLAKAHELVTISLDIGQTLRDKAHSYLMSMRMKQGQEPVVENRSLGKTGIKQALSSSSSRTANTRKIKNQQNKKLRG